MINSPILDTVIGLVFIFLIYSLLATSIKEGIATIFGLRARMLKKGIVEGMLADSKWKNSILHETFKSIFDTLKEVSCLIIGSKPKDKASLGQKFYDHPIIKNYGSNARYSTPSYIPKENFSAILVEVLKGYYERHKSGIVNFVNTNYKESIDFENVPGITKIDYLIKYLQSVGDDTLKEFEKDGIHIDRETLDILALHLEKSYQNLTAFEARLENWFDDSMNRVSGWYKRQVQFILFFIGIAIAIMFNVNIISIAGKLSTDKDARDKLVQIAIKESEQLKDDPRVKKLDDRITYLKNEVQTSKDSSKILPEIKKDSVALADLKVKFDKEKNYVKGLLEGRIKESNNLLALGWGDYGISANRAQIIKEHCSCYDTIHDRLLENIEIEHYNSVLRLRNILRDTLSKPTKEKLVTALDSIEKYNLGLADNKAIEDKAYSILCKNNVNSIKIAYIKSQVLNFKNFLGFILLAIGISLGAPFWFDLLQKLIKIRGSGKKEEAAENSSIPAATAPPTNITVNNSSNQEAIG